jgi:hypothetical protein
MSTISPSIMGEVIVSTPGAIMLATQLGVTFSSLMQRFLAKDWGDITAGDKILNNRAVKDGSRILASYTLVGDDGDKHEIWIISDAANDAGVREVTTFLLPEDY